MWIIATEPNIYFFMVFKGLDCQKISTPLSVRLRGAKIFELYLRENKFLRKTILASLSEAQMAFFSLVKIKWTDVKPTI